jgi:DGQHR domain-containing protein
MSHDFGNRLKPVECENLDDTRQRAQAAAGRVGGIAVPVGVFRQGRRTMIITALPVSYLVSNLMADRPLSERATLAEVQAAKNRPMDAGHAEEIAQYLIQNRNEDWILTPFALNVRDDLTIFITKEPDYIQPQVVAGFLVVLRESQIDITDGQHRKEGLERAYRQLPADERKRFAEMSVGVMLTCDTDLDVIHQDFADSAKTKPISPSQRAVYDRRNPANALVLGLAERCPLFHEELDAASSKLGKTAPLPFLVNQVRQVVKTLMTGTNADAEEVFEKKAKSMLGDGRSLAVKEKVETFAKYLNRATNAIPIYREIAETEGGEALVAKLRAWRDEGFMPLTGGGGRLGGRDRSDGHHRLDSCQRSVASARGHP